MVFRIGNKVDDKAYFCQAFTFTVTFTKDYFVSFILLQFRKLYPEKVNEKS